ncbi:MAG: methyltransferase [Desulfuromonadaceae bacterium]|nr:methyltransferase [Desulfuromonadaceae bacterium]
MKSYHNAFGTFNLDRYPTTTNPTLQAWDAADSYLLEMLQAHPKWTSADRIALCNDRFGALAVTLAAAVAGTSSCQLHSLSDSWLSHEATRRNLALNHCDANRIKLLDSLTIPENKLDILLIKIPKSIEFLKDTLVRLRPSLTPETLILAAGLVKQITPKTVQCFEQCWGKVNPSLAQRKARVLTIQLEEKPGIAPSSPTCYQLDTPPMRLYNHANVFCQGRLDMGSRLLLEQLDKLPEAHQVIDLGCGNGVLGLAYAQCHPACDVLFIDESYMALASARLNAQNNLPGSQHTAFMAGDGLHEVASHSAELILCNPPFHQQAEIGDDTAWQMFHQARRVLNKNGCLVIVGNRHLGYHVKLKRLFGNCQQVASNRKFVILLSHKH